MFLNKNIKLIINYFLGPLVFLLLGYSIYRQVTGQAHWLQSLQQIKMAVTGPRKWEIAIVLLMMPLNWGIEARKWQLAVRPVEHVRFVNAFKAVLTGTTMASFTPNRMGEYLGRILYIREGRRLQAVSLTIICSMAQLLVTMIAGMAGILYILWQLRHPASQGWQGLPDGPGPQGLPGLQSIPGLAVSALRFWMNILLFIVMGLLTGLTIFYFRISWLVSLLEKFPALEKYKDYIKLVEEFPANILMRILLLSFLRYTVFMFQYQLLFTVFGVGLTVWQAWSGMSVVFLIMAVVPTFTFLTELGLRWEAGIQVIQLFSANAPGIFVTSFGIWLVNLIIPALAGSLLILSIKLFRNR